MEPANAIASAVKVLLACRRTPAPVDVAAFVGPEPDPVLVWLPVGLYKKKKHSFHSCELSGVVD